MSKTKIENHPTTFHRLTIDEGGKEVARVSLFVISNGLHPKPYGLMEDLWVDEENRGKGHGSQLIADLIALARRLGMYKLIATSRHNRSEVHAIYLRKGFENHGVEFRMNLA